MMRCGFCGRVGVRAFKITHGGNGPQIRMCKAYKACNKRILANPRKLRAVSSNNREGV